VTKAEIAAGIAEVEGLVARSIVGHDTEHFDAEAFVVGDRGLQERNCAFLLLARQYLHEREAGGVIDADMDIFPAEPFTSGTSVALSSAIAGDPMADAIDATKLLDVQMDYLAEAGRPITPSIGGIADMPGVSPRSRCDATDP